MNTILVNNESELSHLAWLNETGESVTTSDGHEISIWELVCDTSDSKTWTKWAKHFREHYCSDDMIEILKAGTPFEGSKSNYLTNMVFPDSKSDFGPQIRAGDFAEILISDLIENNYGCWVPRTRYIAKSSRNESSKGTDVIGLKVISDGAISPQDELYTFEAKAQFSGSKPNARLQDAINDSIKDGKRKADSLNAIKQRLLEEGNKKGALRVQRFQDALKSPYIEHTGAAALFCSSVYDSSHISANSSISDHPNKSNLKLIVIRSSEFMKLVHQLYQLAANEA